LAANHREIVITGINLCAYEFGLVNAVEAICEIDAAVRVRLGSLEPDMLSDADITRLAALPKLCRHFHLSLQSGSDATLARMNRRYDTAHYRGKIALIRRLLPNAALTTDIIAGFPGETDAEFAETLAFAQECRFDKIHVFTFSPREGTAAAAMSGQIPAAVKKSRFAALNAIAGSEVKVEDLGVGAGS
jgi:threonylcarbamoyladenosine tRNA methylthiotransferase MtaB